MDVSQLVRLLHRTIDSRIQTVVPQVPALKVKLGRVSSVSPSLRQCSVLLDGHTTPTPYIPYPALPVTLAVDDRVVVLLRDDGWKELLLVNGRDVGSNLPIVVDVRDFGQAGDPLALQAAIDAVSGTGAVLSSPAAVYEALSPITLGSGYTFAAHGVIIRRGWASSGISALKYTDALVRQRATSWSTPDMDLSVLGLTLDNPGGYLGVAIGMFYCQRLTVDGLVINGYQGDWATAFNLRDSDLINGRIRGGDALFEDGLHIWGGDDIRIHNWQIDSGDDSLVLGTEAAEPYDITRVVVSDVVVSSTHGFGVKVYTPAGVTPAVTNNTFSRIVGMPGQQRSGGIAILNLSGIGTDTIQETSLDHVNFDATGNSSSVNPYGLWLYRSVGTSLRDVTLRGFTTPVQVYQSRDDTLDNPHLYGGTDHRVFVESWRNFTIRDGQMPDIPSGKNGLFLSDNPSYQNYGTLDGNTISHAAGASAGYAFQMNAGKASWMRITGNDMNAAYGKIDTANLPTAYFIDGSNRGFIPGAANADTTGATLAALETEVNELKATLRLVRDIA